MAGAEDVEVVKKYYLFQEISSVVCHSNSGVIIRLVPRFILVFPKIFDNDLNAESFFSSLGFKIYFMQQNMK